MHRPTPNLKLARNFDEARKRIGMSISTVAAECTPRLHPNTVQRIGYGIATPATIERVAKVLGLTAEQLAGRSKAA
ncbi:MAG: helix-turn-helix transcriptional regulator [Archangiaceae bacterium]|nr:helix-turn-helix transcriptional regulator [Archangiaceae bacterium]